MESDTAVPRHTDYDIGGIKWQSNAEVVAIINPDRRGPLRPGLIVVVTSSSKILAPEDGSWRIGELPRNW